MEPLKNAKKEENNIDPEKVRAAVRRMKKDQVFCLLDRAIDLLSQKGLRSLVKGYLDPRNLQVDVTEVTARDEGLLAEIQDFAKRSLAREYYEAFEVNDNNRRELSPATKAWKTDLHRLLEACYTNCKEGHAVEARDGYSKLFSLLGRLDAAPDEILFFADEGGTQVMEIDWDKVLNGWFSSLAQTTPPDEYAWGCRQVLKAFSDIQREWFLGMALLLGNDAQRDALAREMNA